MVLEALAKQIANMMWMEVRGNVNPEFAKDPAVLRRIARDILNEYPKLRKSYSPHAIFRMGLGDILTLEEMQEVAKIEINDFYVEEINRLLEAKRPRK